MTLNLKLLYIQGLVSVPFSRIPLRQTPSIDQMDLSLLEGPPIYDARFTIRLHHRNLPRIRLDRCATTGNSLANGRPLQKPGATADAAAATIRTSAPRHQDRTTSAQNNNNNNHRVVETSPSLLRYDPPRLTRPRTMFEEAEAGQANSHSPSLGHTLHNNNMDMGFEQPRSSPSPPRGSSCFLGPADPQYQYQCYEYPSSGQRRRGQNSYQLIWLEDRKMWVKAHVSSLQAESHHYYLGHRQQQQLLQPSTEDNDVPDEPPPSYETIFGTSPRPHSRSRSRPHPRPQSESVQGSRWMELARRVERSSSAEWNV